MKRKLQNELSTSKDWLKSLATTWVTSSLLASALTILLTHQHRSQPVNLSITLMKNQCIQLCSCHRLTDMETEMVHNQDQN